MSAITDEFERACRTNSERTALYFESHGEVMSKTFAELKTDVEKAEELLIKSGVGNGKKLLAFASPDYNLLVYMLASFKIGASIMYVDIFAKQDSLKNFFDRFRPSYVLVSNKTRPLKPFFKYIRDTRVINVDKPLVGCGNSQGVDTDDDTPALITATTGSSGRPKAFVRTHKDLLNQLTLIRNNIKISNQDEVILTTSYIYAFANLIQGFTTVLPNINLALRRKINGAIRKLRLFDKVGITVIMTSPDFCLKIPNLFPDLKQLYFGGAILNYNEAKKIEVEYGGADIWYIYGSTECALISGILLKEYAEVLKRTERCLLGDICDGVDVHINENRHILVNSEALLKKELGGKFEEEYYDTGDIGYLDGKRFYYVGKNETEIKINGKKYWANEIEQRVVLSFSKLLKCAVVEWQGENYAFVEGDEDFGKVKKYLVDKFGISRVIKMRLIPRDPKHHTKINYTKLKRLCDRSFSK